MDDKPQLTDIQEGLRDAIRYQEELGGILQCLQEEVETILRDSNSVASKTAPNATYKTNATKQVLGTSFVPSANQN